MSKLRDTIADFTASVLTDDEIITEALRNRIRKALAINCHLTSCYALQVERVVDIHGRDSRSSGFYFVLAGTRCGVSFFLSNDLEIIRKPDRRTVREVRSYDLHNHPAFSEGFWCDNF